MFAKWVARKEKSCDEPQLQSDALSWLTLKAKKLLIMVSCLPGNTRRITSGLLHRTPATYFWPQIGSLETQDVSYHLLNSDMVSEIVNPFSKIFNETPVTEKLPNFNAIPINLHWRQDNKVILAC